MDNETKVVKHLEMIQRVIIRLAHNSFWVKGWSMAFLSAAVVFASRNTALVEKFSIVALVFIASLWILDGYFLYQERSFGKLYDAIRQKDNTDFTMVAARHANQSKVTWLASIFSVTLVIFYGVELFVVAGLVLLTI